MEGQKLDVISRNKESNDNNGKGHHTHILSLAVSTDGKFLVRI